MENVEISAESSVQQQLNKAISIAKAFGATRLILFGSAVNNPQEAKDIDIACDGVEGWSFYALGARLEEELDMPLDLVSLSPATPFTEQIKQYGRVIFER